MRKFCRKKHNSLGESSSGSRRNFSGSKSCGKQRKRIFCDRALQEVEEEILLGENPTGSRRKHLLRKGLQEAESCR